MEFQQGKHWKCRPMRLLIIPYCESQSWNGTDVSKAGRNSTEDDARIRRPKTSVSGDNVEIIKGMVMSNRQITAEELVEEISISHGLVMLFYVTI